MFANFPHYWQVYSNLLTCCAGALAVAGGLVILCTAECRDDGSPALILACVSLTTGSVGPLYLAVMSQPLQLSRRHAAPVGALSWLCANAVKFSATFAVHHLAQSVSPHYYY